MASLRLLIIAVLLVAGSTQINGGRSVSTPPSIPKGRLLTPEEGCGQSKVVNTRIIGGTRAKVGAWPWMALLGYTLFYLTPVRFICGGSLITTRHVLTAAHCVKHDLFLVRLGEHNTYDDDGYRKDVLIRSIDKHDGYNDTWKINDIAILHLWRDVAFNDRISPICLPLTEPILSRSFVDSNPFLVGWGTLIQGSRVTSAVPHQVQVPVVKNEDCKKNYLRYTDHFEFQGDAQFGDRVICAGHMKGGKDSCQGDSGGPLMLPILGENGTFPFYQIGIISWAEGCAKPNLPGINTNIQYYASWINKKLINHFKLVNDLF